MKFWFGGKSLKREKSGNFFIQNRKIRKRVKYFARKK